MRKDSKKSVRISANFPTYKTEVRELVHLPRRSPDTVISRVHEPTHINEAQFGNLYVVGSIEDASGQEQTLLNTLALEARRSYYHGVHGSPEERFRHTLQQLNTYLAIYAEPASFSLNPPRFHVSIMVVIGHVLMVGELGSVFSYLLRDGEFTPISQKHPPHQHAELWQTSPGPFAHFVKGQLLTEDTVVTLTPHFADTELRKKIGDEFLSSTVLQELMRHSQLHRDLDVDLGNRAAAAMILQYAPLGEERFPTFDGAALRFDHHTTPTRGDMSRSKLHDILETMLPRAQETPAILPSKYSPPDSFMHRPWQKAQPHLIRWYIALPLAAMVILGGCIPPIRRLHRETSARLLWNAALTDVLAEIRTSSLHSQNDLQKRTVFAQLAASIAEASAFSHIPSAETGQAKALLENAIRRIDRETVPQDLQILTDFSKLSIEFFPETLLAGESEYIIAQKNPVQFARISAADKKTRMIITGMAGPENIITSARTLESEPRLVYISNTALAYFEPQERMYVEQRITPPRLAWKDILLTSGAKEIFIISSDGTIFKKYIHSRQADAFSTLPIPKSAQLGSLAAAGVLPPFLYLLTTEGRFITISQGKIIHDTVLQLRETLGKHVRLVGLLQPELMVLLDSDHARIVLLDTKGKMLRQYRHELFKDMRDAAATSDRKLLVLTTTQLLSLAYDPNEP